MFYVESETMVCIPAVVLTPGASKWAEGDCIKFLIGNEDQ